MRLIQTAPMMLLATALCIADEPSNAKRRDIPNQSNKFQFDGTWKPKGAMLGGNLLPPAVLERTTLTVKGDQYEVKVDGEEHSDKGIVTRDESVTPHRMTIKSLHGANKGKTFFAIYEIKGPNAYRVCYDLTGTAFPTEFKSPRGSKIYLVGYRRQQGTGVGWTNLLSPEHQ